ncbi:hypothetical protein FRC01_013946 [Tulasnella sp. 417]|nr:hypothetical protein FRC01_013946 [Tulasnella sp. 417]
MSSESSSSRSPSPEPIELPAQLWGLCELTASKPESLVHGDTEIQAAALRATKFLFDRGVRSEADAAPSMNELLKSIDVPQAPVTRSQVAKQKAGTAPPAKESITFSQTPLSSLVLDGMGADQIWAQLELRAKNICAVLDSIIDREPDDDEAEGAEGGDMDVDQGAGPSGSNGVTRPFGFEEEEESEEDSEESGDEEDLGEDIVKLRDHEEEEEEQQPVVGSRRRRSEQPIWRGPRHPTLDDGFFGIDKFNRDTELMEAKSKSRGRLGGDEDDSEEEEEIDLFAPIDGGEDEEDDEMELDEEDEEEEEGDEEDEESDEDEGGIPRKQTVLNSAFKTEGMEGIMYGDFFRPPYKFGDSAPPRPSAGPTPAPPPPKAKAKAKAKVSVRFHEDVRVKKIKARGKGKSLNDDDDDDEDDYSTISMNMNMNGAGGAFFNPFMNMTGPGGFGGFAPRQPVVAPPEAHGNQNGPNLNGRDPFAGIDDMDREDSDEDYEEEDHEDGMDDEEDDEEDDDEADDDEEEDEDGEGEDDFDMDEGQEAIERLKNDIFAEPEESYRAPEELSTHEKRLRAISQEIAILEDQNVAEKPWTQMGEANAKRRPENSLLETDLEFEASAKPAPIITEEATKSLEDIIKARVLENRFDDVIRQRPVDDKAFLPSKMLEISDKEAQKGLAEIYAEDYTAAASGEGGRKDDRLTQEHKEIEKNWGDICYKLDALCNAHFTPKQPKATISTLSNVASASLESALPASVSTSTLLAPEEMFAFDPRAATSKTEMSPAEKKALRTKVKHERKAQGQMINGAVVKFSNNAGGSATAAAGLKNGKQPKNAKEAKDAALESLVKTGKGVTVVGKPHVGKSTNTKDKAREGGASLKL